MSHEEEFLHKGWVGRTIHYSFDIPEVWRFEPYHAIVDSDGIVRLGTFNATWQAEFERAMGEWTAVAGVRFIETAGADADLLIGWNPRGAPGGIAGDASWQEQYIDGWIERNANEGFVVRMDPYDTDIFFKIALHEIGHVLGLGHTHHGISIMKSIVPELEHPGSRDIFLLQKLYGPPSSMLRTPAPLGHDSIVGTHGDDEISGGNGKDTISGFSGDDVLFGNNGIDDVFGGEGNDIILGNIGGDYLVGGDGDDVIFGGQNNGPLKTASDGNLRHIDGGEWLQGGTGNDTLLGQYGNEYMWGEEGDDVLFGGQGDDNLLGGYGSDILVGGRGNDDLSLGSGPFGNDRCYFGHNSGNDTINGFNISYHALERPYETEDRIYIQFDVNGSGIRDGHDVLARMSDNEDGDAVIDLGDSNSITIFGYGADYFYHTDFVIY